MNNLTIVMYHYVRDLKNSKYPDIKGLDISLFKEQIDYMEKHYTFVTMEQVISSINKKSTLPDKSILLTFDDAYIDHYTYVFPVLDKFQIQGTFFVPAKAITEHVVLDVNKIHFILASVANNKDLVNDLKKLIQKYTVEYNLSNFDYYYNKLAKRSRYDSKEVVFIKRLLQVELTEELRGKIIDHLFIKYIGIRENIFSRELYMNKEQLKHMLRSGMHIGNHGYNHYWWNHLSKEDMKQELELSIDFLDDLGVDMSNWTACYPYGSYNDQSINMLNERGCKLAVTTEVDVANTNEDTKFLMPRLDANDIPKNRSCEMNGGWSKA